MKKKINDGPCFPAISFLDSLLYIILPIIISILRDAFQVEPPRCLFLSVLKHSSLSSTKKGPTL